MPKKLRAATRLSIPWLGSGPSKLGVAAMSSAIEAFCSTLFGFGMILDRDTNGFCEQNDPCSGCYQFDTRAPSVCVFQRFNGCNGGAAYFPWNGHLSQQCVGEWSLEILRGLCTLYPRIVPICTPHVWCELISPNTKDGNLWMSLLYICLN